MTIHPVYTTFTPSLHMNIQNVVLATWKNDFRACLITDSPEGTNADNGGKMRKLARHLSHFAKKGLY